MAIGYFNSYMRGLSPDTSGLDDYRTGTWTTSSSTTSSCSASTRPMTATEIRERLRGREYEENERRSREFSERPGFKTAVDWEKYYSAWKQPIMEEPRVARIEEASVLPRTRYMSVSSEDCKLSNFFIKDGLSDMTVEDRDKKYRIEPGQEDYYRGLFQYYKTIIGDQFMCYDMEGMPIKGAIELMKNKLYNK